MTRGAKEKVKVIEVKPVQADDRDHMLTFEESNVDALPGNGKMKFFKVNMLNTADNDLPDCQKGNNSSSETKEEKILVNNVQSLIKYVKATEDAKTQVENEADKTNALQRINTQSEEIVVKSGCQKVKRKKKKGKTKKEKDKNKECALESEPKGKNTEKVQTVDEIANILENTEHDINSRKLPCLFGFISTWLAKRKERRRIKKRKAIEARNPTPEPLVEYEHKKARGGVAFTVEVDSRPMRKPVLPPIRQRPGPIVREIDKKLKHAEIKRSEELEKKKISSKEHAKKKAECHDRKSDKEFYFKQKVDLTIRHKQGGAQKNRARFHEDRRCSTPLLRAPSTLPPLRGVGVKLAASTGQKGICQAGPKHDPDDAIFDF